ncbi:MAG: hypothetical protein BWY75_01576 [bacterium ADurb.Bin425]|nr:MAG: hypothetical protein BWY75_01576 [bacterium ADurb.Bin425]
MRLTKGVTAGDERHCFFVVHSHSAKGFANIMGGGKRVGVAVWSLWVDIDQAHLGGCQRFC